MTRRRSKQFIKNDIAFRLSRIAKLLEAGWIKSANEVPDNSIPVDPEQINISNSYHRPICYVDQSFNCQDCGSDELWKAEDQYWYYETIGAYYFSEAIRCRICRKIEVARKNEARKIAGHD